MSFGSCTRNSSFEFFGCTYVLITSGSVGVLVRLRGEEIHVSDLVEEGFAELTSGTSLGGRGETLDGSNKDKGKNDGVGLHVGNF